MPAFTVLGNRQSEGGRTRLDGIHRAGGNAVLGDHGGHGRARLADCGHIARADALRHLRLLAAAGLGDIRRVAAGGLVDFGIVAGCPALINFHDIFLDGAAGCPNSTAVSGPLADADGVPGSGLGDRVAGNARFIFRSYRQWADLVKVEGAASGPGHIDVRGLAA